MQWVQFQLPCLVVFSSRVVLQSLYRTKDMLLAMVSFLMICSACHFEVIPNSSMHMFVTAIVVTVKQGMLRLMVRLHICLASRFKANQI